MSKHAIQAFLQCENRVTQALKNFKKKAEFVNGLIQWHQSLPMHKLLSWITSLNFGICINISHKSFSV